MRARPTSSEARPAAGFSHCLTTQFGRNLPGTPVGDLRRIVLEPHRRLSAIALDKASSRLGRALPGGRPGPTQPAAI